MAGIMVLMLVVDARANTVFVSPLGEDTNPGTKQKPVASLERARDTLRAMPKNRPRKIILRGGTYRVSRTLTLGLDDSGTDQAPVVWEAAPSETVRLVGGMRLTDWRPVEDTAVQARLSPEAREHVVGGWTQEAASECNAI
jgi:hypothetical protein